MTVRLALCAATISLGCAGFAHADQSCASYPYTPGMNIEDVAGGVKILSTAVASVSFDDVDAVNDARDEATVAAKAQIVRFMTEQIGDADNIEHAVNETKSMQGNGKQAQRQETISRVRKLSSSASGLLRGVVLLGDCYTAGRELRITVGLKPDTIAQAGSTADAMTSSLTPSAQPGTATGNPAATPSNTTTSLMNVPGYSNTDRIKGF
jgi:hypothetical protein